MDNIRAIKVLGSGATGTVFLAHDTVSDPLAVSPFALKVIPNSSSTTSSALRRAHWELAVLSTLRPNPFLPTLIASFDTPFFFAYSLPFCPGSDLNVLRHRLADGVFSESAVRFYSAETLSALQHLHDSGIVYRDLKPENILIQSSGHIILADFDLSRKLKPLPVNEEQENQQLQLSWSKKQQKLLLRNNSKVTPTTNSATTNFEKFHSFVGTEEYVAPEVVRGEGHEFSVDWWALGVLAYEMLYGTTPFKGRDRKETFNNIVSKKAKFVGRRTELVDLIELLLEKEPTKRLGYRGGAEEIKGHEFFRGVRWEMLSEVGRPPFVPPPWTAEEERKGAVEGYRVSEYFENKVRASPETAIDGEFNEF